jgi:hypothetical protein
MFKALGFGLLLILAANEVDAQARKIDYREDALQCVFTKDCGPGHSMVIGADRRVDFSQCLNVNYALTWNPTTNTLTYRGAPIGTLEYVEERRARLSVGFVVGQQHVNFSAGNQTPTLRFRASPEGPSPILRYLSGACRAAG